MSKKEVKILVANPAGNITIFVLDPFEREQYQAVANQLLALKDLGGEQVCFIKSPYAGVDGKMEMCGLEFCGNASRTFGLICAIKAGKGGKCASVVDVSGCDHNLTVQLDLDQNYTKVSMPLPIGIAQLEPGEIKGLPGGQIVDLGGIVHVVLKDAPASDENFQLVKEFVNKKYSCPPAIGAMFYDTDSQELTPIVYVADVDTTYWEGSCGSGSTAVACAFTCDKPQGEYSYSLKQPAGTIVSTIVKGKERIEEVYIEGPVSLSEEFSVTLEL